MEDREWPECAVRTKPPGHAARSVPMGADSPQQWHQQRPPRSSGCRGLPLCLHPCGMLHRVELARRGSVVCPTSIPPTGFEALSRRPGILVLEPNLALACGIPPVRQSVESARIRSNRGTTGTKLARAARISPPRRAGAGRRRRAGLGIRRCARGPRPRRPASGGRRCRR